MRRVKHSLSHYVLSTFDMGQLIPVGNYEVLPGDSVRMSTSCLLRVSPLMAPVMHPVQVRIHHWFVPYRLLWEDWEDFITGGPNGDGAASAFPQFTGSISPGQIGDYMGLPTGVVMTGSILPVRAYNMIYNEFYRDQDLQPEIGEDQGDVQNVAWEKDYFTAARPFTQKGPEITVPVLGNAPVRPLATEHTTGAVGNATKLRQNAAGTVTPNSALGTTGGDLNTSATAFAGTAGAYFSNLYAELGTSTSAAVNDVRLAFALQRYAEARAQYGSRYSEYLRYLGVRSSDARLQRPEYLGGGRATISFSEVLKTGEGDTPADESPIGELRGHGISAMRSRRWVRFFEEHGIVLSLASVRPRSIYGDGIHRQWLRSVKEHFWTKELEQIGQQEIQNREVYAAHSSPEGVFGYGDRYSEYRHHPSYVNGEFRSTMNDWHLGRQFAADPALNAAFIECVPSKRIHAEQTSNVLWGMFSHSIQARRMVGKRTIGRIF